MAEREGFASPLALDTIRGDAFPIRRLDPSIPVSDATLSPACARMMFWTSTCMPTWRASEDKRRRHPWAAGDEEEGFVARPHQGLVADYTDTDSRKDRSVSFESKDSAFELCTRNSARSPIVSHKDSGVEILGTKVGIEAVSELNREAS